MPKAKRKLDVKDLKLFQFLWRWKLGTPLLLYRELAENQITFRRFWQRLRRLYREGFLEIESGFCDRDLTLYRLTKIAFQHLVKSTDFIPDKKIKPHAIFHDYLATCFHLTGKQCTTQDQIQFWTEQEASINEVGHFPQWVPGRKEHIPDGYSLIQNGLEKTLIAFEIEISQKSQARYLKMLSFFGGTKSEYDFVFWLVSSKTLAEKILGSKQGPDFMDLSKHQFFLLNDFIKNGEQAKCFKGTTQGKSLKEIYQILSGNLSESQGCHKSVTAPSLSFQNYCFENIISPRGFNKLVANSSCGPKSTPS